MLPSQQQKKTSGLSFLSTHSLLRRKWTFYHQNKYSEYHCSVLSPWLCIPECKLKWILMSFMRRNTFLKTVKPVKEDAQTSKIKNNAKTPNTHTSDNRERKWQTPLHLLWPLWGSKVAPSEWAPGPRVTLSFRNQKEVDRNKHKPPKCWNNCTNLPWNQDEISYCRQRAALKFEFVPNLW